jgi:hypothetical protein
LRVFFDRGGTAASNVDYTSVGGFPNYIDFPANELTVTQAVVPLRDNVVEPAETVILTLNTVGNPPQYTIGASGTATVTISDFPAIVNVQATDATASEETLDQGEFTFTRSGGNTSASLRVFFSRGGTAASNVDYTSVGGFPSYIDFPANELTVTQRVVPLRDNVVEPAETVILTLLSNVSNPPQYTIGASGTATVTISDFPAIVNITATDPNASESGDQGLFTFTRSGGNASATLRVFFDRGGTATNNIDYAVISAFIDFPANVLTVTQAVVPVDDALDEPAETVILTLSSVANPPQYTIGASGEATVTIADND